MSKLARAAAVGVLLTAMSLGSAAYAQDGNAQSQPAGITQSDPSQPQDPGTPTDPAAPQDPGTPQNPGTPQDPGVTPGSTTISTTTTTPPPVSRPKKLPVTVSPRAGRPGTTVMVRADLRGCTRPNAAHGFFNEVYEWNTDGLSRWLVSEHVSGGRWYRGQFLITKSIPPGLGRFGVICDNGQPNFIEGFATFLVQPSNPVIPVRVNPQAGGPGTTVRITADLPGCARFQVDRYDSKGRKSNDVVKRVGWDGSPGRIVVGRYTIASSDPVGQMRFVVTCFVGRDAIYQGSASFQVGTHGSGGGGGGSGGNGGTANRNDSQFPNRVDTGLGGPADGTDQGGLDRLWLPAAGLLLIVLAVGLWLGQASARRRP
jgi:hypothetical protein